MRKRKRVQVMLRDISEPAAINDSCWPPSDTCTVLRDRLDSCRRCRSFVVYLEH